LIEGEEEVRSEGIEAALNMNATFFPKPDVVLISNTTWLGYGFLFYFKYSGSDYFSIFLIFAVVMLK